MKTIEATTNHDVKAVEYFIKEKLKGLSVEPFLEFIHFGLTSQDVNNTAIPLLLQEALTAQIEPAYRQVYSRLQELARQWNDVPMLARTHGQPASPTRLGKELMVYCERLEKQLRMLTAIPAAAKFGGATGNFNAHTVAYPDIDWQAFGNEFVSSLGLVRSHFTIVAEGIQTVLRREGYPQPYEALKALTRKNEAITAQTISQFIDGLNVSEAIKAELRAITPFTYTTGV